MNAHPNQPAATANAAAFAATSANSQPVARGFALYIGVDADTAAANGTSLSQIAAALRKTLDELVPGWVLKPTRQSPLPRAIPKAATSTWCVPHFATRSSPRL